MRGHLLLVIGIDVCVTEMAEDNTDDGAPVSASGMRTRPCFVLFYVFFYFWQTVRAGIEGECVYRCGSHMNGCVMQMCEL